MKLLIAIVNNDDSAVVSSALTNENFIVTKLSTTGGFLMVGNTTFLIGANDEDIPRVKEIIKKYSQTRTASTHSTASFGRDLNNNDIPTEVKVGGATVFVLDVNSMDKY